MIVLLRPQAAHSNLNGTVVYAPGSARGKMHFEYEIIRLWEIPAGDLVNSPVGTVPLAMLGKLADDVSLHDGLADVVQKVVNHIINDAPLEQRGSLLTSAYLLTGLRIPRAEAKQLFQGVRDMTDSDTYLAILDEGREEQSKRIILRLGRKRFDEADATKITMLNATTDIEKLEELVERVNEVSSWKELFE